MSESNVLRNTIDSYEDDAAYMIYEYFRATGASEAAQGLPDLFSIRLQNDGVQDCDVP